MKKILILIIALFLSTAIITQAAPMGWDFNANVLQPISAGWNAVIHGNSFTATSTTATSTFPNASTTNLKVSRIYDNSNSLGTSGQVLQTNGSTVSWATISGGASNFWNSFVNYISPSTSTDGILVNGSSTITNLTMTRSTTTNATTTNMFVSGSFMTASGTTLNNGGYNKRGNNNQIPIVISEMGTGWSDFYARGVVAFSTTTVKSGTSSLAITAANTGLTTGARNNITDFNGSQDNYVFWARSDNWSQVTTAELLFSTAGVFTDTFTIDLKQFLVAAPNNEWIEIIAPRSNFTRSSAASNWSTVNDAIFRITSTSTPTVWFDRLSRVKQQNQPMLAVVFDDAWQTQYTTAKPIMDNYAMPGTAYVIWNAIGTSQYMTQSQVDDLHDLGWDIGGHGATNLTTLSSTQVETDLQNMKLYLNQRGYRGSENYALPNGAYNSSTLPIVQKYFATQRTIDSLANTSNYINPNRVSAFSPSQFTSTSTLFAQVDRAIQNNDFIVITFHNIVTTPTIDTDYATQRFQEFIDYVALSGIKTVTMSAAMNYNDSFTTKNDSSLAIGTTTTSAKLTVQGSSLLTRVLNVLSSIGSAIFTILDNGNAGFGTTTPTAKLQVVGTSGSTTALFDVSSSTGNSLFNVSATGTINIGALNASSALFLDANKNATATALSASFITSLQDETGTGVAVFGTSPAFTTSVTTPTASFTAWAGATTLLTIGGTGASASLFAPSTLDTTSSITGAIRTSGGISAAKALNIGTTGIFGTSVTAPIHYGGSAVSSVLDIRSTSGVGTSDAIRFSVGNNGATEAIRMFTNGNISVGSSTASTSKLFVNGGVQLNTQTAKPTCAIGLRGTFWASSSATGVKDTVEVCAKDAADAYAWRTIY